MIPLLLSVSALAASPVVSTLYFDVPEEHGDVEHRLQEAGPAHLELGVSLAESALSVGFDASRADRVTVLYRYETSITLSFEGPHWDLTDFVHGDSGWKAVPQAADGRFNVPEMPTDVLVFPDLSAEQIAQGVREYLGRFGPVPDDLPRCASPTSDMCSVGLSRVWLSVSAWKGDTVVESHLVEFVVPMGC